MKKNILEFDLISKDVVKHVENWLTTIVIELNLCPFAQREYQKNRVRFKTSFAKNEQDIVADLVVELSLLNKHKELETSLLILPNGLAEFENFNDFLGISDTLLKEMNLDGVFQIASFHPQYRFAGTAINDAENFTNRAPYPILHILRESSLDWAVDQHPDTNQIPIANIALMNKLGVEQLANMLAICSSLND